MTIPILKHVGPFLCRYDALICDVWGVLHDGVRAYEATNDTLTRYRAQGGSVVLLSNSPQPSVEVERLLAARGVRRSVYDAMVTSGDLTSAHLNASAVERFYLIGPQRHGGLTDGLRAKRSAFDTCELLLCTGFDDDRPETIAAYDDLFSRALARKLPLLCANPDRVVDMGGTSMLCAGTLAAVYEERGGTVIWCGKPYARAYEAARAKLKDIQTPTHHAVLAIGDAAATDIAGAAGAGFNSLFLAQGIHRNAVAPLGILDEAPLDSLFKRYDYKPTAAAFGLNW